MNHPYYVCSRAGTAFARLLLFCCCLFIMPALRAQQATQEWAARYNDQDGSSCRAVSVAADTFGNSYVTGTCSNATTGVTKLVTVKYSPAGQQLWLGEYSGGSAQAIAVDNAGGVYVTGTVVVNYADTDYLTVRYDAATGTQTWARTYNALYGDPAVGRDSPIAIAVDNAGGVYVTGTSSRARASTFSTVRYDAATGVQSWARTDGGPFAGARAIAVDNAGGIYVTGTGRANPTVNLSRFYVTARYDAVTGDLSWLTTYANPVVSTYNFSDASAIAVDNSGGVYVTGTSRNDYATVRYAAATGAQSWVSTYNGPANGSDDARAIAVDNTGGVYVTGTSSGGSSGSDYATVRYGAATGAQSWTSSYNGPANGPDEARAIAVDNAGGVYVTGTSSADEYATVRYRSTDGSLVWLTGAGPQNSAAALALDNSGNVFVTGTSLGSATTGSSFLTIKYSQTTAAGAFAFYRAINLNGPALTLDGNAWAGSTAPRYSTNGASFQNQRVPLIPATDAARAGMIRASVYGPNLRLTLSAVPAGAYQAYLYVWEDNNAEVYNLSLNGQVVRAKYNSGPAGTWARLGPYPVTLAAAGTIRFTTSGRGWANFSGVELWQQQSATVRHSAEAPSTSAFNTPARRLVAAQSLAYPNPSADGRFHLLLPEDLQGEVAYTLVSAVGKQLSAGTLRVPPGGTADLDFSRQMTEPGMCYLQLKGAHAQTNLKLLRN